MELIVFILLGIFFVNYIFIFRFQRVTLNISRILMGTVSDNVQMFLTPNWIGILGWLNKLLIIVLSIMILTVFNWMWLVIFIFFTFFGMGLFDFITIWLSYKQCFNIIRKSISSDITKSKNPNDIEYLKQLLKRVEIIKNDNLR